MIRNSDILLCYICFVRLYYVFYIFLFIIVSFELYAQEPVFKHYTVEDGLPGSEIYCVMQDSKGFIWFSSDHGICRFDGTSFRTYTTYDGLADNTIFTIVEDSKHRLWFQSFSGRLSYFQDDKMYLIKNNEYITQILGKRYIRALYVSPNDTIWVSEAENIYLFKLLQDGSCRFIKKTNKYEVIITPDINSEKSYVNGMKDMLVLNNEKLKILIGAKELQITVKNFNPHLGSTTLACIPLLDHTWLLGISNKLVLFNEYGILNTIQFKTHIISLYQSADGKIWVMLYKGGVKCFNPKAILEGNKEECTYLEGLSVTSCLKDKEGGIWFSTLEKGVYFLPSEAFYSYPDLDKLPDKKVIFVGGRESDFYVGLMDGSLLLNSGKERFKVFRNSRGSKNVFITSYAMLTTPKDEVWFSFSDELLVLNKDHLVFRMKDKFFNSFTIGAGDIVWASFYDKLCKFKDHQIIKTYSTKLNIRKMCEWKGKLWLACVSGLYSFDNEKIQSYEKKNSLLSQRITDLQVDKKNRLWMSTLGGGVLVQDEDTLIQIGVKEGLISNLCNTLLIDTDQNVWVGTNSGISRINALARESHYKIDNYTVSNGLISNEVRQFYRQKNKLWLATNNGLSMIDLNRLNRMPSPLPIYMMGIKINNKDTALSPNYKLRYTENNIQLSYVGISFTGGGKLQYRYTLQSNHDNTPGSLQYTTKSDLQFNTLAPGDYIFSVWARNADGIWSQNPAYFSFTILPPFWATWWFRLLCVLFIMGGIILFFRWRLTQLMAQSLLRNELNEVKQQALTARMNPHFMFNALNSIQNYISTNQKEDAHKYLSKFSRLMRLILLNSKDSFVSLQSEIEALKLYIDLEVLRFRNRISCDIYVDPQLEEENYKIPAMVIQPFVENSIKHGLVPKEGEGKLEIVIKKEGNYLICTITDNGIGRVKSATYNLEKNRQLRHESMGMALTENRIKLLQFIYDHRVKLEIIDLYDDAGLATGTKVILHFPVSIDTSDKEEISGMILGDNKR